MTPEQKAALVMACVFAAQAEMEGMKAQNAIALAEGAEPPYHQSHFDALSSQHLVGYNSIVQFFRG